MMQKIRCFFGYHEYYLIQKLNSWSRKIGCLGCDKTFGMNDHLQVILEWDYELEELYISLGCINREEPINE